MGFLQDAGYMTSFILVFVVLALFTAPDTSYYDRKFDREVWHEHHRDEDLTNPRGQMVGDLLGRWLEPGMSQRSVEKLLGEPDYDYRRGLLSYRLGRWSGLGWDLDTLDLKFDENRRLAGATVSQRQE